MLALDGYDLASGKIINPDGEIALVDPQGNIAASWGFAHLLKHWTRKHAKAAYVPSQMRKEPSRQYYYGGIVRLAVGTSFLRFLKAMAEGLIYYDPGIKLENATTAPKVKRRSQFRVRSRNIRDLYDAVENVRLIDEFLYDRL